MTISELSYEVAQRTLKNGDVDTLDTLNVIIQEIKSKAEKMIKQGGN